MENKCKKCKTSIPENMDLCPSCKKKSIKSTIITIIILVIFFIMFIGGNNNKNNIKPKTTITKQTYSYKFIEENKQLTWNCKRSEWIYVVDDNVEKNKIPLILNEIYNNRKHLTDRTNIWLYTKKAYQNIKNNKPDTFIWSLNDGFSCSNKRKVKIKNNWDLYHSF